MAQKNRTQLNDAADSITAQINALYADNTSGAITEEALRTVSGAMVALAKDLSDSAANLLNESPTFLPPVVAWLNNPPGSPVLNGRYLTGQTPYGDWAGHGSAIAVWTGAAWSYTACTVGQLVPVTGQEYVVRIDATKQVQLYFDRRVQRRVPSTVEVINTDLEGIPYMEQNLTAGRTYLVEATLIVSCTTVMTGLDLDIFGPNAQVTSCFHFPDNLPDRNAQDFGAVATLNNAPTHSHRYLVRLTAVVTTVTETGFLGLRAARTNTTSPWYIHTGSELVITDTTTQG